MLPKSWTQNEEKRAIFRQHMLYILSTTTEDFLAIDRNSCIGKSAKSAKSADNQPVNARSQNSSFCFILFRKLA